MLSFFRRFLNSRFGVPLTFVVLGVIALAFVLGDVPGMGRSSGSGAKGDTVVTVGKETISDAELKNRAQQELQSFAQQQPGLTMADYVANGGLEATLNRAIDSIAWPVFGERTGMRISKASIDQQIASFPGLLGADGKFSQQLYQQLLQQQRMTDAQLRERIAGGLMAQRIQVALAHADPVAQGLVDPYSDLLLERRTGKLALIPSAAVPPGPAPTDAELTAFYKGHIADFTVPESRTIRYALVTPDAVKTQATPTDAEVAAAYKTQAMRFAATQKASGEQVIVADQAAATALAAKVKAGTPLSIAAKAAGLEPTTFNGSTKAQVATATSPAFADAVFAAQPGAIVGPVKTTFGYGVAKLGSLQAVAGQSLDQARPTLVAELTETKTQALLQDLASKMDDASAGSTTFDEMVSDNKLQAQTTPALTAQGVAPDQPGFKLDPALGQVVAAAFAAEASDGPQLVPIGQDGAFAVVALGKITPSAPRPLAMVRDAATQGVKLDRANKAARAAAGNVLAALNKGTPLAQALAATGLKLPPVAPLDATRAQLASAQGRVPPPLALMFAMQRGGAKLLAAPNNAGWLVIQLDQILAGDPKNRPAVAATLSRQLAGSLQQELVQQFTAAVRADVGVKKNDATIAKVKAGLAGNAADAQD